MALRRCCRWLGRLVRKVWFCVLSGLKTGIEYKASLGGVVAASCRGCQDGVKEKQKVLTVLQKLC